MAQGAELASVWVRIVPTMEGVQGSIAQAMSPAVQTAEQQGQQAGAGFVNRFGVGLAAMPKMIAGLGIAAAAAGISRGLWSIGETFDAVTDTIRIGTGASGAALAGLVEDAKAVGRQVPAEWDAVAQTVADLNTRLGLTGPTLQTVAAQVLEAGRMTGQAIDVGTITGAFNAFQVGEERAAGAMDHLFRVSQATGIGINELGSTVQAVAPLVQGIGWDFDQTAALVGVLDKAGLNANTTLSKLAPALVRMAKDGEQPAEVFPRVVEQLQAFIEVGDEASAFNLAEEVFGSKGAAQFVAALRAGAINMADLNAVAGMTGDTILGVSAETMDFAERWQLVGNLAQTAIEPIAAGIFDGIGNALAWAMPGLQAFGGWISENQWVLAALAAVIGVTLVAAFVAWTASIWASTVALLANPVTWIVLGIVALIAILALLVANWDAVVAWVSDVWAGFVGWVTDTLDGLGRWWDETWAGIGQFFQDTWNAMVQFWLGVPVIGDIIRAVMFVAQNWDAIWAGIGKTFEDVWTGIGDFFRGVANGVLGAAEGFANGFVNVINGIIRGVNSVTGAIGIPAIPLLPKVRLPRLAEGGIVMPRAGGTLALLAEAGRPEVVLPLDRLSEVMAREAPAGGGEATAVFSDEQLDQLAERLARVFARERRLDARMVGVI